ncbi:hypothetical protein [Streptomyces sp. NPDC057545]
MADPAGAVTAAPRQCVVRCVAGLVLACVGSTSHFARPWPKSGS